jgi:Fe-Mn family superoxide dismutase
VQNTQWENATLENIILKYLSDNFRCQDQKIFNNAAQHYNHSFYWRCISPDINEPSGMFLDKINQKWGSK